MSAKDLLEGWTIKEFDDGRIVVQTSDGSGIVVGEDDEGDIASSILHRLAKDLIDRGGV